MESPRPSVPHQRSSQNRSRLGRLRAGSLVVALALAGFIAAVGSYKLSLAGEYGPLPHVHAALVAWIVVAYVGCGLDRLVEEAREPIRALDGRCGPCSRALAAGRGGCRGAPRDSARVCFSCPPFVFIHVFLAYPSGRLVRPFDRIVVITGYSVYFGLDLVRLLCRGDGPQWRRRRSWSNAQPWPSSASGPSSPSSRAGGRRAVRSGSRSSSSSPVSALRW